MCSRSRSKKGLGRASFGVSRSLPSEGEAQYLRLNFVRSAATADAPGSGVGYGVLQVGRACLLSIGVPALPMLAALEAALGIWRGLCFAPAPRTP
jgi:hypothetical protein